MSIEQELADLTRHGIVGIDPSGRVFEGYDEPVNVDGRLYLEPGQEPRPDEVWTPAQRAELATEMIRRWRAFGGL